MSKDDVVVKKVRPFPIPAQIKTASGATLPIQIVKLTTLGFLAEIAPSPLQPGEKFEVSFEFPVLHERLTETVVMVKLYQSWGATSAAPASPQPNPEADGGNPSRRSSIGIVQLIEMHFVGLSLQGRRNIDSYLSQAQRRSS